MSLALAGEAEAGLDVFAEEPKVPAGFYSLDNAVLFPHVGSATHDMELSARPETLFAVSSLCFFKSASICGRFARVTPAIIRF